MSDVALGEQTYFRDDSIPWEGILLEYFSELASSDAFPAGFGPTGWNFTWTSVSSRAAHSSSWTAAVADVANGLADAGLSLFWMTAERLEMTSFTSSLTNDVMYLFVPKPRSNVDLWRQIIKPFEPFSLGVWLTVGMIIVTVGTLQVTLTKRLWWPEWSDKVQWDRQKGSRKLLLIFNRLMEGWYEAYMGVVTGGIEMDDSHRLATRFLNMGLGLFLVIFLSAYTANLAAFLSRQPLTEFWSGLDDATAAGAKVCAHVMLEQSLSKRYPDTDWHFRYMDSAADVLDGITRDGCSAFVVSMRSMRTGKEVDAARCELGFVLSGTAVAELAVALPASPMVADVLSYWFKVAEATNGTSYQTVQERYQHPPQCPLHPDLNAVSELEPLDVRRTWARIPQPRRRSLPRVLCDSFALGPPRCR